MKVPYVLMMFTLVWWNKVMRSSSTILITALLSLACLVLFIYLSRNSNEDKLDPNATLEIIESVPESREITPISSNTSTITQTRMPTNTLTDIPLNSNPTIELINTQTATYTLTATKVQTSTTILTTTATPPPTINATSVCTLQTLNNTPIYDGPSEQYTLITTLPSQTMVTIIAWAEPRIGEYWSEISTNNYRGWIKNDNIPLSSACAGYIVASTTAIPPTYTITPTLTRAPTSTRQPTPTNNPNDSDGDNFLDNVDICPQQWGTASGCPDQDGDGRPDNVDQCPNQYANNNTGCPGNIIPSNPSTNTQTQQNSTIPTNQSTTNSLQPSTTIPNQAYIIGDRECTQGYETLRNSPNDCNLIDNITTPYQDSIQWFNNSGQSCFQQDAPDNAVAWAGTVWLLEVWENQTYQISLNLTTLDATETNIIVDYLTAPTPDDDEAKIGDEWLIETINGSVSKSVDSTFITPIGTNHIYVKIWHGAKDERAVNGGSICISNVILGPQ